MKFDLFKTINGVRIGEIKTNHGVINTPFFMPVATVGSVKGVSPSELRDLGCVIVLSNTYHLYLRPGEKLIKKMGGLHQFMRWDGPILTDSGGYQVFSLGERKYNAKFLISPEGGPFGANAKSNPPTTLSELRGAGKSQILNEKKLIAESSKLKAHKSLVKICDDGVEFTSHLDGSKHFFTPEKVIDIQLDLGVDILMPLDVCPSGKASKKEIEEAVRLTIEWARRAKAHFNHKRQETRNPSTASGPLRGKKQTNLKPQTLNTQILKAKETIEANEAKEATLPALFGIVQGGLDSELRRYCAEELIKLDFDGYAVGGLAVDYETRDMWRTVKLMGEMLPQNKPRYLMGVGTPDDILAATKLGMDMFDCVLPTRLARHGSVFVHKNANPKSQTLNPKQILNPKCQILKANEAREAKSYNLINLLNSKYRTDGGVIEKGCGCPACRDQNYQSSEVGRSSKRAKADSGGFSRAYLSHLIRSNEILGLRLATLHNLYIYLDLMGKIKNG